MTLVIEYPILNTADGRTISFQIERDPWGLTVIEEKWQAAKKRLSRATLSHKTFADRAGLKAAYLRAFQPYLDPDQPYCDEYNRAVIRPFPIDRALDRELALRSVPPTPVDPRLARARAALGKRGGELEVVLEIARLPEPPALPRGMRLPRGHRLLAALDLAHVAAWDLQHTFPARGVVYVFIKPDGFGKVLLGAGKVPRLEVTPRYQWEGPLPRARQVKVEAALGGVTRLRSDDRSHFFGRPVDLQAEGDGVWRGADPNEDIVLLAQLRYGEGFVLVGFPSDRLPEVRAGQVVYTGT